MKTPFDTLAANLDVILEETMGLRIALGNLVNPNSYLDTVIFHAFADEIQESCRVRQEQAFRAHGWTAVEYEKNL